VLSHNSLIKIQLKELVNKTKVLTLVLQLLMVMIVQLLVKGIHSLIEVVHQWSPVFSFNLLNHSLMLHNSLWFRSKSRLCNWSDYCLDDFDRLSSFGAFNQLIDQSLLVSLLWGEILDRMLQHIERVGEVAEVVEVEREIRFWFLCYFCVSNVRVGVSHN